MESVSVYLTHMTGFLDLRVIVINIQFHEIKTRLCWKLLHLVCWF